MKKFLIVAIAVFMMSGTAMAAGKLLLLIRM
jgi:hypothetical protein